MNVSNLSRPEWLRRYQDEYLTLDEAGAIEGVSREAIRQRLNRLGVVPRTSGETSALKEQRDVLSRAQEIRSAFLRERSIDLTAEQVGLPNQWIQRYIGSEIPDYEVLTRAPRNSTKHYTNADLHASLQEAATGTSGPLTAEAYRTFVLQNTGLADGRPRPGQQAVALRYGSWRGALTAAGLPANPHSGPAKTFSESEGVSAVRECWRALGRAPTATQYDQWQRTRPESPSGSTVRKLTGSWNSLLVRVWQLVHGELIDQSDSEAAVPEDLLEHERRSDECAPLVPYVTANERTEISLASQFSIVNYNALERAVQSHARIQNRVADAGLACGLIPKSPSLRGPTFDIALVDDVGRLFVVEVKSATEENLEFQLRVGLGQVLRYAHQLRSRDTEVVPVLALERAPDAEWRALLGALDVGILVECSAGGDLANIIANPPRTARPLQ